MAVNIIAHLATATLPGSYVVSFTVFITACWQRLAGLVPYCGVAIQHEDRACNKSTCTGGISLPELLGMDDVGFEHAALLLFPQAPEHCILQGLVLCNFQQGWCSHDAMRWEMFGLCI